MYTYDIYKVALLELCLNAFKTINILYNTRIGNNIFYMFDIYSQGLSHWLFSIYI